MAHGGGLDLVQPLAAYLFTSADQATIPAMLQHELLGRPGPDSVASRARAAFRPKKAHSNFKNLKGFTRVNALFKVCAPCSCPVC